MICLRKVAGFAMKNANGEVATNEPRHLDETLASTKRNAL